MEIKYKMHPKESCMKCGSKVEIHKYVPYHTGVVKNVEEHLIMKCGTCGYEFLRLPLDSNAECNMAPEPVSTQEELNKLRQAMQYLKQEQESGRD